MGKKTTLTNMVLENMRNDLINWNYDIGDIITEQEVSSKYNVSKTPAREALTYLCIEGLLEKIPHKGYYVKGMSIKEVKNLFQFRAILEKGIVEILINNASDIQLETARDVSNKKISHNEKNVLMKYTQLNFEFHITLARLTRNPYLDVSLGQVLNQLGRALALDLKISDSNKILSEHENLINALFERNIKEAQEYVMRTCSLTESRIFEYQYTLI